MVDTVNETVPDPEELAEEEGGSGMPMTAAEIEADDQDDIDDEDSETDPESDEPIDDSDEDASDEAAA